MAEVDAGVTPARIDFNREGVPHALEYGDVYHAADGGPAQARHVFLDGNGLPRRWRKRRCFGILETGFGLGTNFLCTLCACLEDPDAPLRLDYVAVEKHPPREADLARVHAQWPAWAQPAAALRRSWPPALRGFHRLEFAAGRVVLTLLFGEVVPMLRELDSARFDAIYLDGFAPQKNPQMWSAAVFDEIGRLCRGGASAATWSVAGVVRAGLQSAGFDVERRSGFGRKREMLVGHRTGMAEDEFRHERRALVIGAGAAGCWTAHALVRRGWTVDLVERHDEPAQEASGNPVGALLPALNLADNANARLARAAFLHTSRVLSEFDSSAALFDRCGLLHLALERAGVLRPDVTSSRIRSLEVQRERMQAILQRHRFPQAYVRWIDAEEAADAAGAKVGGDGWWIPAGGWVRPQKLCAHLLHLSRPHLNPLFGNHVQRLRFAAGVWQAIGNDDRVIAQAPVAIVANAYAALTLGLSGLPRLIAVRGQITCLPADVVGPPLRSVVCGDGYAAPLPDGGICVGATFEPGSTMLDERPADHADNLRRAERMLPGAIGQVDAAALRGRVGLRTATADRLPACGALPAQGPRSNAGLHLVAGLGARGLIWAPLCAEILAARLEGESNPVESSLIGAMLPGRDAPG